MGNSEKDQTRAVYSGNEYDEYCMWVGRCLSAWSLVEARLNQVFALSLGNAPGAHEAYWSIVSFDARLKMTSTALLHRLDGRPELVEKWRLIEKKVMRKSRQRNKIGHGTVMTVHSTAKPYVRVFPYLWKDIRRLSPQEMRNALDRKQLEECMESFNQTEERLA